MNFWQVDFSQMETRIAMTHYFSKPNMQQIPRGVSATPKRRRYTTAEQKTAMLGQLYGSGPGRLVVDDPHAVVESDGEAELIIALKRTHFNARRWKRACNFIACAAMDNFGRGDRHIYSRRWHAELNSPKAWEREYSESIHFDGRGVWKHGC